MNHALAEIGGRASFTKVTGMLPGTIIRSNAATLIPKRGSFEAMVELAGRYSLPFAQPDWLPDVIQRYGLTPLPGM